MITTMRDLPLSLLRSLAAVYAEGGVRPAARRLGVEHSAVSRAIRELQATLGEPVIEQRRRGQGLVLTPEALALAKASLAAMIELDHAVSNFRSPTTTNHVSIATLPSIAARWLLPKLPDLKRVHPDIDISIVVDQPRGAEIDPSNNLTLRMGPRPDNTEGITILGDDTAFPVMAPSLWAQMGSPVELDALRTMRLIHDQDSDVNWMRWRREKGPGDLDVKLGPRMTSSDLALQAAEQGQGVTICRSWLVEGALSVGALVRPFGHLSIALPSAWWLHEGNRAGKQHSVRKVRDWLREICVI